jgi:hypothetical protein
VRAVVAFEPDRDWSVVDSRDFMGAVREKFSARETNEAYWWFVVYGFFRFNNIDEWGLLVDEVDEDWDDSVDYARLAPRRAFLLDRLKTLRPSVSPASARKTSKLVNEARAAGINRSAKRKTAVTGRRSHRRLD